MAKVKVYRPRISSNGVRKKIKFYYLEKFFNKWMNKYEFSNLNYQQKHYIMKKFWSVGTIACSQIRSADPVLAGLMDDGSIDMGENKIIFTPWTFANRYNIYDFPTHVKLINTRGVKFITTKILEIDKEVVIGYAQKNHKSIYSSIEAKIDELVDVEMKKRVSRKAQSQPWMFAFSPEDFAQAKVLQEQLENDEPYLFAPFNDVDKVKGITSGAPYVVDKFEQDRQKIENDILTMLGVNNVGISEKKEHLIVDEVNANNEDIEQQSISFRTEIEDFFDRVYKVFGYKVDVYDMNEMFKEAEDEVDEKEEDQDGEY
jgi:hypothetical protein